MMDRYEITGNLPLDGEIECSGSKNASLPLMAAALMADGITVIEGVPDLHDIRTMAMVLKYLGADVKLDSGVLTIDSSECHGYEAPYELVRKMRASFYVLGPLLARHGRAKVSLPGGCALGPRPVDLHIKALRRLGCQIEIEAGYVIAKAEKIKGTSIHFDIASVGATGNLLMASAMAEGETTIENAACEPEIIELADFLKAMGAEIRGAGKSSVTVTGVKELKPVSWKVIPDRIETGTLLIAGAITGGRVKVTNCRPDHLSIVLGKLNETGAMVSVDDDGITVDARDCNLRGVDINTNVYPGFPTDLQPLWMALMCIAKGNSVITETIYTERFTQVPELVRLGAQIHKELNSAYVEGVDRLVGASVMCSDIRAAAALVLAALAAHGRSSVLRIYHLDRGYDRLEDKLTALGAQIRRLSE